VILLLDGAALLWWPADDPDLFPEARRALAEPANDALVSAGSLPHHREGPYGVEGLPA